MQDAGPTEALSNARAPWPPHRETKGLPKKLSAIGRVLDGHAKEALQEGVNADLVEPEFKVPRNGINVVAKRQ